MAVELERMPRFTVETVRNGYILSSYPEQGNMIERLYVAKSLPELMRCIRLAAVDGMMGTGRDRKT